jgi:hypothetical protein
MSGKSQRAAPRKAKKNSEEAPLFLEKSYQMVDTVSNPPSLLPPLLTLGLNESSRVPRVLKRQTVCWRVGVPQPPPATNSPRGVYRF